MDQQVPTEALAEVGMLIHPIRDWYVSIWNSKLALDYFSRTYFHLFTFEKKPADLFPNQFTSQITPLQRYKPEM